MENITITTTKNKAIKIAKSALRSKNNVKRLSYSLVKDMSCQCSCGETGAVKVVSEIKSKWYTIIVGYCSYCGEG